MEKFTFFSRISKNIAENFRHCEHLLWRVEFDEFILQGHWSYWVNMFPFLRFTPSFPFNFSCCEGQNSLNLRMKILVTNSGEACSNGMGYLKKCSNHRFISASLEFLVKGGSRRYLARCFISTELPFCFWLPSPLSSSQKLSQIQTSFLSSCKVSAS